MQINDTKNINFLKNRSCLLLGNLLFWDSIGSTTIAFDVKPSEMHPFSPL